MASKPIPQEIGDWIEMVIGDNSDDLLKYLLRRVTQPEDAADLLARVMLALWENGARVPVTHEGARMWCFGIARNVLREHYRHGTKRLNLADKLRDRLNTIELHRSADAVAEDNIRAEIVRRAVGQLDERSRELLILVHWDGFTIAQAARILAMNESSARTRHGRALKRLERMLSATLPAPEQVSHAQPRIESLTD